MKVLYIESKLIKIDILSNEQINSLPKEIFIAYTIQYKNTALAIKEQLESNKIKITCFQQVLGCSKINNKQNVPVLLIGTGRFHALNLYLQSSEVFVFEPGNNKLVKVSRDEIKHYENKKRAKLMNFLNANKIGILVSTKSGQENLKLALKIKNKLENKGKEAFLFISNNIPINQLENFNIDSWINTACPGLDLDNPKIINYSEINTKI